MKWSACAANCNKAVPLDSAAIAASPANSPCRCSFRRTSATRPPIRCAPPSGRPAIPVEPEVRGFAEDLFRVALAEQEKIDALIAGHSTHWRLDRMPAVDRNLLRMAVAELLGFKSTPFPIVINEALEIGRRYCAPESINFLNGVLDSIARSLIAK